ncbi:flavin monoamine oxidase family protein [Aquimarina sp. 2201CG5-10]|uniref:flavin monoamine oxidase family protein n=1 Tax=Aquimarina callyspongiae TaxID=3098150 RepID=UPI002AB494EA|nr:FAD-dependent oxidoreductase [Aquimarina sp. 2201CG5-10]MDY8134504.1 FAD-dependent oxidoreductase [Aquimarina sp. 2201CG5-10]
MKTEVLIIGAGLTGMLLAYRLKKKKISFKIIEARDRIGGRIHTILSQNSTPIEMGATWLGSQHQELLALLKELELPVFDQFMKGTALFESLSTSPVQKFKLPENQEPSYRIKGGTSSLIQRLASELDPEQILLNEAVTSINYTQDCFTVHSSKNRYTTNKIVSTLPPMLLVNSIQFDPQLSKEVIEIANHTHTWMGESIKFGVSYSKPFWKENNLSGIAFSNVGPITELYDHSNLENTKYALKGFLHDRMYLESKEHRKSKVMHQLQKFFGDQALQYLKYEEVVWRQESNTSTNTDRYITPHQNNGHPIYQIQLFDQNFFMAGTETALHFGGYMDGAVRSAQSTYQKLIQTIPH